MPDMMSNPPSIACGTSKTPSVSDKNSQLPTIGPHAAGGKVSEPLLVCSTPTVVDGVTVSATLVTASQSSLAVPSIAVAASNSALTPTVAGEGLAASHAALTAGSQASLAAAGSTVTVVSVMEATSESAAVTSVMEATSGDKAATAVVVQEGVTVTSTVSVTAPNSTVIHLSPSIKPPTSLSTTPPLSPSTTSPSSTPPSATESTTTPPTAQPPTATLPHTTVLSSTPASLPSAATTSLMEVTLTAPTVAGAGDPGLLTATAIVTTTTPQPVAYSTQKGGKWPPPQAAGESASMSGTNEEQNTTTHMGSVQVVAVTATAARVDALDLACQAAAAAHDLAARTVAATVTTQSLAMNATTSAAAAAVALTATPPVCAVVPPSPPRVVAEACISPLHVSLQSIDTLMSPEYWRQCCPALSCCAHGTKEAAVAAGPCMPVPVAVVAPHVDADHNRRQLQDNGFFKVASVADLGLGEETLVARLLDGVRQLMALGHHPNAISCFDEYWELLAVASRAVQLSAPTLAPIGDCFTFVVTPHSNSGFVGPHRDKPLAGPDSFLADGTPKFATVWVALTPAQPENSCLYFVPKPFDREYTRAGDELHSILTPADWPAIVAQPVAPGGMLCFSHRIIHWGSARAPHATAGDRVALSFALADASFEEPQFDFAAWGAVPPLRLRVALVAGQRLLYSVQQPFASKVDLALQNRIFQAGATYVSPSYREKVSASAQWQKFMWGR